MNEINNLTIQQIVEKIFFIVVGSLVIATFMSTLYFNYTSIKILRENALIKTHTTLSHLIIPALQISDTTEIRRLLSMSSSRNEIFAVIDINNNIFLADYLDLSTLKLGIINKYESLNCKSVSGSIRQVNHKRYLIYCTSLINNSLINHGKKLGMLLSLSPYPFTTISPFVIYFLGTITFIIILAFILFRHTLNKKILAPLVEISQYIHTRAKAPLSASATLEKCKAIPNEVLLIKNAFDQVLSELKDEYHNRIVSSKNAALSNLAARVAHDIRSPLATMQIILSNASMTIDEKQYLILNESIQSVRNIANNLLDQYREPLRQTGFDYEQSNGKLLSSILQSTLAQKQLEWVHNKCKFVLLLKNDVSLSQLNTNADDLKRIISNLLNNAYEAQVDNVEIHIKSTIIHHSFILLFKDFGCGIPQQEIKNVLNGLSLKHHGKGLGLSSARPYMNQLGGELKLNSVLNKGTIIRLIFPLCTHN